MYHSVNRICFYIYGDLCISSNQVEVQSLLFAEAVGGASGNALKSIAKRFNKLWKEVKQNSWVNLSIMHLSVKFIMRFICTQNPGLVDQYMSSLLSLDQNCVSVPLLGLCVDFCTSQKDISTINKHKVMT